METDYQLIAIVCSCNMSGRKTCVRQNKSGIAGTRHPTMTIIPSITDGVHRNENFMEIIPVFLLFQTFSKKKQKRIIKAILCNFSMRLLKYFLKNSKKFFLNIFATALKN